MKEETTFGEIKKAIRHNRSNTEKDIFEGQEKKWITHDASISRNEKNQFGTTFGSTFFPCLPKEYREYNHQGEEDDLALKRYIENILEKGGTAVEFGGPGSNLFGDFSEGFFRKTIGICLEDIREKKQKEADDKKNHSVIIGDILDPQNNQLLDTVLKTLGTKKTNLIISRMMGVLLGIKKEPAILDHMIRAWYRILDDNGLMFVQFELTDTDEPKPTQALVIKWKNAVKEKFPQIDIQLSEGVLRLHKKEGAPGELPPATQLFK